MKARLGVLIIIAITAIFSLSNISNTHDWGDDFALYILHARQMAEGKPYAETGYIYNELYPTYSPQNYSVGFPLLLAPFVDLFGLNFIAYKIYILFFFLLFLWVLYVYFAPKVGKLEMWIILSLIAICPFFYLLRQSGLSDIPGAVFFIFALILFEKAQKSNSIRHWIGFGIIVYCAFLIRPTAIILIPAALYFTVFHARSLLKGVLYSIATFFVLTVAMKWVYPVDGSYIQMMQSFYGAKDAHALYLHLSYMLEISILDFRGLFAVGNTKTVVNLLIYIGGGLLFLFNWTKQTLKGPGFLEVLMLGYFIMVILWPGHQGIRYFTPVLPLYFYYIISAIQIQRFPKYSAWLKTSFLVLAIITSIVFYTTFDSMSDKYGVTGENSAALFKEINDEVPQEAVIMALKPRAICLMTGRKGIVFPDEDHGSQFRSCISEHQVSYLVIPVYGGGPSYIKEKILPDTTGYSKVYSNDEWLLYKIN